VFTRQKMVNLPIYSADELYKQGLALLEREFPLKLRLMGLRYLLGWKFANVENDTSLPSQQGSGLS